MQDAFSRRSARLVIVLLSVAVATLIVLQLVRRVRTTSPYPVDDPGHVEEQEEAQREQQPIIVVPDTLTP